jgi:ADP-ribose pyrophosphatase YjhB (NUDIX family)
MTGQRISAGGIVVAGGKLLLVHHYREGEFDFWVLPGGGIEGDEGIFRAAEREVLEETNLQVRAERIAYIEEFIDEGKYVCKFWVYCHLDQGEPSTEHKAASEEYLKDARFFSAEELKGLTVYPKIVQNELWQDLAHGFPAIKYLGYR